MDPLGRRLLGRPRRHRRRQARRRRRAGSTLAAATPYTFYGLIAERQLGLDPAVGARRASTSAKRRQQAAAKGAARPTAAGTGLASLVRNDVRARRAAALAQVGLKAEAGQEIREGPARLGRRAQARMDGPGPGPRRADLLACRPGPPRSAGALRHSPVSDAGPAPQGGFTIDTRAGLCPGPPGEQIPPRRLAACRPLRPDAADPRPPPPASPATTS